MQKTVILQELGACFQKDKFIKVILYIAFALLLCVYVSNRIAVIFTTNIELANGESNNVWNILKVINGDALYTEPEEMPFEIFQYSPISQLIYVGVSKFASRDNYLELYRILRFFNLIVNCIVAVFGFFIAKKHLKLSNINAFVVAFFCLLLLGQMCWVIRPDALSVMFLFISCVCAYKSLYNEKLVFISALFTILALFTKQDAIQLFVIIPVSFFLIKRCRLGIKYLCSTLMGCSILLAVFYGIYGDCFVKSVIGGVSITPSLMCAFNVLNRYLQLYNFYPILIVVASMYMIIKSKEEGFVFLSMVLIGTFIFALGSSTKLGAWPNYYTLPNLLGVLILSRMFINMKHKKMIGILSICWAYYFFTGILFHYTSAAYDFDTRKFETAKKESKELKEKLPYNFKLYTPDKYLKLEMAEHSILPNTEYYGVSPFDMSRVKDETFYIFTDNILNDYIVKSYMDAGKIKEICVVNNKKLYSYGKQ